MFSLGFIAYEQKEWGDSLTWFRRAADSGHHRSLFWIGKLHWRGHAVTQSRSEAMKLFHLAAKKKVPDATRALRWLSTLHKIARNHQPARISNTRFATKVQSTLPRKLGSSLESIIRP